ncbi:uncharacterized protein BCR38DRAFT_500449, partial [Pseudomassariella vexata]
LILSEPWLRGVVGFVPSCLASQPASSHPQLFHTLIGLPHDRNLNDMGQLMIVTHLRLRSPALRDELVAKLRETTWRVRQEGTGGMVRSGLLVPREEEDGITLYTYTVYEDAAAIVHYRGTPAMKEFYAWNMVNDIVTGIPTMYQLELIDGLGFCHTNIPDTTGLHAVLAELKYKPDTVPKAVAHWKDVIEKAGKEEEEEDARTVAYNVATTSEDEHALFILKLYQDPEGSSDGQGSRSAIVEGVESTKSILTGQNCMQLKIIAGFIS